MKKVYSIVITILFFCGTAISQPTFSGTFQIGGSSPSISGEGVSKARYDGLGNLYIVGSFYGSADFDPGVGTAILNTGNANVPDGYLAKYTSAGAFQWAIPFHSTSYDAATSLGFDNAGNILVGGNILAACDFDPGTGVTSLSPTTSGATTAFLAKYDAAGNYIWAVIFPTTVNSSITHIAVDASDNMYLAGYWQGVIDFDPGPGTNNITASGQESAFIAKYNTVIVPTWIKQIGGGGTSSNYVNDMYLDASANIYACGGFGNTISLGGPSLVAPNPPTGDAFVVKYTTAGTHVFSFNLGSTNTDAATGIVLDNTGNVYVAGYCNGTVDFDPTVFTHQLITTSQDIFLAKYTNAGAWISMTGFGGSSSDYSRHLKIDASNNLFLTGYFQLTADFDPGVGVTNLTSNGSFDIFFAEYNSAYGFQWVQQFGGTATDSPGAFDMNANGEMVLGGTFGSTVDFDPGVGTSNLTASGYDDAFVTFLSGCSGSPAQPGTITGNTPVCQGTTNNYSITAVSGATSYTWVLPGGWTGTSTTNSINATAGASGGTISVTANNGCGSSVAQTLVVSVNPAPTVSASATSNTICNGGSTTLNTGGANSYVWNPGNLSGSSVSVSPTTTTTYTVTGTGGNGCTGTNTTTITVNSLPNVSASATSNTICNGSSTTLNSGGANTYVWNPGNLSGSSVSVSPTTTTTYTVTGTAGNGCTNTNTTTITVNIPPTVNASATSNTICSGNSTTLNSSGANTYIWNPGNLSGSNVSVSPTTTTTYTVTGTAGNGCTGTSTTTITVNTSPTVSASATSNTICNGNSTTLNSSGANTYVWNPGNLNGSSVSVFPTTTTTYTVTGTAGNGCTGTNTVTITVNTSPTVNASATSNTICSGNSTTLNSSGANTYVWNPGNLSGSSVSVSPTTTTTYTVTGTAGNGCTGTNTVTITLNTSPTVSASATSNTICSGSSTTLNSGGANTYVWNPGNLSGSSVSVSPTTTTTYTVTGTAGNSCTGTNTVTITVNSLPNVTASAGSGTICDGSSTTLTSGGANTYVWNPGNLSGSSVSVSPTTTTTYTVTGTAANGCTNVNSVTITVNSLPNVTASATNNTICNGNSTTLNSGGANTYVWNPGNQTGISVSVSPTTTTTYTVTGTGGNGCSNTNTVTITVNALPNVSASATSNSICIGNSTTLNAGGASTYVWNPGNLNGAIVSISPTATTTYTVTGTAGNGCTGTNTVTITVNSLPTVSASATSNIICNGNSTTLNSTGANTYVWNPGNLNGSSVSVSPTTTTTYTVTGTAASGCSNTNTTTITVNPLPTVSASATNNTICNGGSTTLNSSGANTYVWNPGNLSGSSVSVSPTTTTTYTVTGTAASGCTNTNTVTINVGILPTVSSNASSNIICSGDPTTLTSGGANTYVWNPGNLSGSSVSVSPTTTTTYTVTGTDVNGCSNTSTVSITVNPLPNVTYTQNPTNVCINNAPFTLTTGSPASGTYSGPGVTGTSFDPSAAGAGTWNIAYSFTDVNGCTNTATSQITVGLCTGTNTSVQANSFHIYPNPFNESISIKCDNLNGQTNVCIYDELGQLLKCVQITNNATEIDTRELSSGIYMFRIITNDQVITKKLVKTN